MDETNKKYNKEKNKETSKKELSAAIEQLRQELQIMVMEKDSFMDDEILQKSKKMDELLNKYYNLYYFD